jgi:hypothetical protein
VSNGLVRLWKEAEFEVLSWNLVAGIAEKYEEL